MYSATLDKTVRPICRKFCQDVRTPHICMLFIVLIIMICYTVLSYYTVYYFIALYGTLHYLTLLDMWHYIFSFYLSHFHHPLPSLIPPSLPPSYPSLFITAYCLSLWRSSWMTTPSWLYTVCSSTTFDSMKPPKTGTSHVSHIPFFLYLLGRTCHFYSSLLSAWDILPLHVYQRICHLQRIYVSYFYLLLSSRYVFCHSSRHLPPVTSLPPPPNLHPRLLPHRIAPPFSIIRKLNDLLDALEFNQVVIFVSKVNRAVQLNKILEVHIYKQGLTLLSRFINIIQSI